MKMEGVKLLAVNSQSAISIMYRLHDLGFCDTYLYRMLKRVNGYLFVESNHRQHIHYTRELI